MQICRKIAAATAGVLTALTLSAFAQSVPGTGSSSFPEISSPDMPTISSPTIGSGFYMPGSSTNQAYIGPAKNASSTADKTTETKTSDSSAESKKSIDSSLTASDISTLDDMGILNQISQFALSGNSSVADAATTLTNLYTSDSNSKTNETLQTILTELEELKANDKNLSAKLEDAKKKTAADGTTAGSTTVTIPSSTESKAKVLRFTVNGYSILGTCKALYISKPQNDGSFLITGDRRYLSDNKYRTETFHILFKPNEASNGISSYSIASAVTQDYENQYSFLYQLAKRENMTAYRTGNLITMRTTDDDWKLEFLMDLGN